MPRIPGIACVVVLLVLAAAESTLWAQQAGRASGQAARDFDRRDGRRPLGDALQFGPPRADPFGWLAAWSPALPNVRLVCRPLPQLAGVGVPGAGTFLAECTSAPLGPFGGAGGYGGYGPYSVWAPPPPIVLPPEERPHRFYSEFHSGAAGSGVPPLTCDPRPGAPCPPSAAQSVAPRLPLGASVAGGAAGVAPGHDCAEVTARAVTGAVYRGRASLAVLGVERAEDAALAIEAALARGGTVALVGDHGYPLYLPPASFLETVESRACGR